MFSTETLILPEDIVCVLLLLRQKQFQVLNADKLTFLFTYFLFNYFQKRINIDYL